MRGTLVMGSFANHDAYIAAAHLAKIAALGLKASKTGVTFSAKKPISDRLVADLARASRHALNL